MSTLYMVATPIGNLEDITLRALSTLKQADVIACEDTRRTGRLLSRFEIKARVIACHAKNEMNSAKGIIGLLQEGKSVAYVSDAGTPGISDPGSRLAGEVRKAGFPVIPIPGVSALTALLSVCSYIGGNVLFAGFLSPKAGRRKRRINELLFREEGFVIYESPFRVVKTLKDISDAAPERLVMVGREMTKVHEEFVERTAQEVYMEFSSRESLKGEFVIFVSPVEGKRCDDH